MEQNISIIMPIYNQASFVRGALASLERQTFKHWELLIIDDGSTDGVNGKITDYLNKDSRIRYVRNEHNEGLGYSLNLGMQLASYPIVSYLPADDIYYGSHLETMLKTLVENDAQVVVSGMLYNEDNVGGEGKSTYTLGTIPGKWLQLVQVILSCCRCRLVWGDFCVSGKASWKASACNRQAVAYWGQCAL